jgi:hypothetical protein
MKMPRRPWYPPVELDIFGLHQVSFLGIAAESNTERQRRVARVEAGVLSAFEAAVHHLGEHEARKVFNRVLQRPKRGRGKALAPDRDIILLRAYDEAPGETLLVVSAREARSSVVQRLLSRLKFENW